MALLEKLAEHLIERTARLLVVPDPRSFNDPLAIEVSWLPMKGRSPTLNYKLAEKAPGVVRLVMSISWYVVGGLLSAAGLASLAVARLPGLVCAVPLLTLGGYALWPRRGPVFDREAGQATLPDRVVPFAEIHALQLLEVLDHNDDGGLRQSYEVNLVLRDRSRVPLLGRSQLGRARSDAGLLATCIGCPVWDGVQAPRLPSEQVREMLDCNLAAQREQLENKR